MTGHPGSPDAGNAVILLDAVGSAIGRDEPVPPPSPAPRPRLRDAVNWPVQSTPIELTAARVAARAAAALALALNDVSAAPVTFTTHGDGRNRLPTDPEPPLPPPQVAVTGTASGLSTRWGPQPVSVNQRRT